MRKIIYIVLGVCGLFITSITSAATLDILIPTENQKIRLPDVPVKGKVTLKEQLVGKIKWETTVEKKFTTETDSDAKGQITVNPFPTHNSGFGPKVVTAKATVDNPPDTQLIIKETWDKRLIYDCWDHLIAIIPGGAFFTWTGSDDFTPFYQLQFSHKLDPIHDWTGYGGIAGVGMKTYTPLDPGSYQFSVRAKDEAGNIDPSPAGHSFTIQEKTWKPPGCDHPDDNYSVFSPEYPLIEVSLNSEILVLNTGCSNDMAGLLNEIKEKFNLRHPFATIDLFTKYPVLIIPSGGLAGIETSRVVRNNLEEYVRQGGTLICLAQQHGYEYGALPGGIAGYGWLEDQSCHNSAVYIGTSSPIFAGQTKATMDVNVDGYFTQWPDNATILLRRTRNHMPAMLMYPYGKGNVIATAFYSDWEYSRSQTTKDEIMLFRDLISYAKDPNKPIPEYKPNDSISIPITVSNATQTTATNVIIRVLEPDKGTETIHEVTTTVPSFESRTILFNYTAPAKLGIYWINYTLKDAGGNIIQKEIEGTRFAVSQKLAPVEQKDLTFSIQCPERSIAGGDVEFTFLIWNNTTATKTITAKLWFPHHGLNPSEIITIPPKTQGEFTHTLHNLQAGAHRLWASFYDEQGKQIGNADKGFFGEEASFIINVTTDKKDYNRGEDMYVSINIQNRKNISCNPTINMVINSLADGELFNKNFDFSLPANGSWSQTATFTLPVAMAGGVCIVKATGYTKGEKSQEAITTFNLPRAVTIIDPILPPAFDYTSTVSLKITNVGALSLPPGTLAVTFKDSLNSLIWTGTETVGTLSLAGSTTLNFNISIPQIRFEEVYKLGYTLISEITTLTGEINIPCSNVVKLDFDKPSYRIRENLGMNLKITNTGRFREDLQVITSIPDCNFASTTTMTILPQTNGSLTYNFTIPETTTAGVHSVQVRLMLGTSAITKEFKFTIPEAQIVFNINKLNYTAQDVGTFTLSNIGGVDETYNYIVRVIDERGVTIFEKIDTITIRAGEVWSPIEFNIPNQALDGGYTLAVLTTNSKGQLKNFYRPLHIAGINARINISPSKKVFLTDEEVSLITQITNLDGQIEDATLTVKVFSSVEEWLCYTEVNDICDMAIDGDYIWFATPGGVKRYDKNTDKWNTYTAIDGLASNDVTSVAVDNQFVWFGTRYNGISRYDKVNNVWKTFTQADGLVNNEVTSIAIGTDSVWVGSWDGATRYDKINHTWTGYRVSETQPGNFINDIAVDGDYLWFATYDGVRRYDRRSDNWIGYTTQDSLAHNQVCSIGVDGNYLWFGALNGLVSQFDKANTLFKIFITSNNQPENKVNSIAVGTNSVWFATNRGITQYDKANNLWKTFTSQDGLAGNQIKAVIIDNETIWAGGSDGISKYVPATPWQTYTTSDGLSDNEVTSIDIDNDLIWLGTVKGGLSKYNKTTEAFENFTTAQRLSSNYVKAVAGDTDYVWLITSDSISRYERINSGIQNFRYDVELLPYGGRGLDLHSLVIDTDYIWFAGYGGLIRFDKANSMFRRLNLFDNHINAMAKDGEYIYIGTQQGLIKYNKITQMPTEIEQLQNIVVYSINVTEGIVWLGTEQGLYRYDKNVGTIRRFTTRDSGLLRDDVRLVAASGDFVWCATYNGVCRYDKANDTWQVYTTKDGLPSNFIRATAIDSDYAYFATDHGVARIQIRGRLLFQESRSLNVTSPSATITTNIGKISIPGKSYIEASLISRLSQVIDTAINSFQVTSKDVYLVISTDKPVYKPHEAITIIATAYNRLSTSTSVLSLILKREGTTILSEDFTLPPNGSITFTRTFQAEASFVLEGFLDNEKVTEDIKVLPPEVEVIITSQEIVGRDEFDVAVQLKNILQLTVNLRARFSAGDMAKDLGSITLLPNQGIFIQQRCRFTQDGTITVCLSGDVEKVVYKKITFGEDIVINVTPKQLYPEGAVVVPFKLVNTGNLDSEVEIKFGLQKAEGRGQKADARRQETENEGTEEQKNPGTATNEKLKSELQLPAWCKSIPWIKIKGQEVKKGIGKAISRAPKINYTNNAIVITQNFFVPKGTTTFGELIYDLTAESYTLTHSSFFGTGTTSFKVARDNVVDVEIDIAERIVGLEKEQLPINVMVSNLGANEFKGDLRIDTGFYQGKILLELSIGQTKTFTFIGTPTVSAGTYTILAEILHNEKVILSKLKTFELIPQFTFEEIPADLSFNIGEKGTITIKVKNNGSGEGNVWVQLKIADIIDEVKSIWIKSQGIGTVSFNIRLPDDIEDRDYNGYLTLKTREREIVEKIISFHVRGVKISVNAWLDKMLYTTGETATLTMAISNLNPQILADMYAKIQYGGYERLSTFTLTSGTTTIIFQVPVSFDGKKLFYGIYLSSGRSIHLNTLYLYQQKDIVNIYADKQVFKAGATITLTVVSLLKGTLTITTIEGYERSYFIDGTMTIEYKLPDVLTSGTYRFSYTFIPVSLPASAPALASPLAGSDILDEFKFDIIGYQARVLESKLDKVEYQPGDKIDLKLKIDSNNPISGVLRGWVVDPSWSAIAFFDEKATFTTGESIIELTGTLTAKYPGVYKLTYGIYLVSTSTQGSSKGRQPNEEENGKELLLASGAETFDVTLSPEITLISPTIGRVGILITLQGSGFGSNEDIQIDFGTTMTTTIATTETNGNFTAIFTTTLQPADGTITVIAKGLFSGTSAMTIFILDSTSPGTPTWGTITIKAAGKLYLEWNPNLEPDLAEYKIHYGTSTGNYTTTIDTKSATYTLTNLATNTTYYIVLTAYDLYGNESAKSEEKSAIPITVTIISITSITHDATLPLKAGKTLTVTLVGDANGTATFDIGTFEIGLPMTEISPGTYSGTYLIGATDTVSNATITGHLTIGQSTVSKVDGQVTFDTTKPTLTIDAPATTDVGTITIAVTTNETIGTPTMLIKDGAQQTITATFIGLANGTYTYQAVVTQINIDGTATIMIEVSDLAGNVGSGVCTFQISIPRRLEPASGISQTGTVNTTLAPYVVKLTDNLDKPIQGHTIKWTIVSAPALATLSSTITTTNADGLASITLTLGTKIGTYIVTAEGSLKATFTAMATPELIVKLAFIESTAGTLTVGMAGTMTVQTQDRFGNPSLATNTTITVTGDDQSRFATASSGANWTVSKTFTIAGTNNATLFFKQNGTTTPITIATITATGANTSTTHLISILMLTGSSSGTLVGDDGKTTVEVGTGALTGEGYIEIDTSGTSTGHPEHGNVIIANGKDDDNPRINRVEVTLRQFTLHNGTITGQVRIVIPYPDANNDGYVDGMTPPMRVTSLKIYKLVGTGTFTFWQEIPFSQVDTQNKVVWADVNSFSFHILMGTGFERNLEKALVYPNPYYSSKGHICIYFDRLTENSVIQIFTVAGELVWEKQVQSPRERWDAHNSAGEKVASGIYIYLIKDPAGNKKVGKLGVLR